MACSVRVANMIHSSKPGFYYPSNAVEPRRVVVEQLALLLLGARLHNLVERRNPFAISGRQRADRPVAAEHHALRAEDVEHVIDDRRQVVGGPLALLRRGDDARYLADEVLPPRQRLDVALPAAVILIRYRLVAAMIQDEARPRTGVDQLARVAQLGGANADVEAQPDLAEMAHSFHKLRLQTVTGRGAGLVDHLANPLDLRASLELTDVALESRIGRPAGDDRGDRRRFPRLAHLDEVIGLGLLHLDVDVHLHVDRLDNVEAGGGLGVFLRSIAVFEWMAGGHPVHLEPGQVPQVLVRVDDGKHGGFLRARSGPFVAIVPSGRTWSYMESRPCGPSRLAGLAAKSSNAS